jgi:purine-binding chemotaxis protein CheW
MSTTLTKKVLEILVFEVEGQRFGLSSDSVREVLPMVSVATLPRGPAMVEGVINIRGNVVPVLDTRKHFGLPPRTARHTDHLIVARAGDRVVALRVDRALHLLQVDGANVERADKVVPPLYPPTLGGDKEGGSGWVAKLPNDLILVHDVRTFFSRADDRELGRASLLASRFQSAARQEPRPPAPEGGEA